MKSISPYLNFNGNTEEAFTFYQSIFGGELDIRRFKDTPEAGRIPDHEKDKIMHVSLPLKNGTILMATDALESMGHRFSAGNNFHLSIDTENEAESTKLFNALSAGGNVTVPLEKMFWGDFFGMCTDKFGIQWMVSNKMEATAK